jgi:diguanylate cyclase (GGDEF)-like protein
MTRLEEQWALAERYGRPLTIAMVDVDHFKNINDSHGHDGGDSILRQVAVLLRDATRGTDFLCRVGGEEFLIIFPQQTLQEALICAERCRAAMSAKPFTLPGGNVNVTVSVGLATRNRRMTQFTDLLKTADDALYAAKNGGRNLVVTSDQLENDNMSATQTSNSAAKSSQPAAPPIDPQVVLKRCGGSSAFAEKIMDRYAAGALGEVEQIERALTAGDADLFRRSAHSLKSMSAYVSADEASSLAAQLEELGRKKRLTEAQPLVAELRKQVERATAWIIGNRAANAA